MGLKAGIDFRLSLLGLVPAGLIGLGLAAYFIHMRNADLDNHLVTRGHLLAHQLAQASLPVLDDNYRPLLRDIAEAALRENDVVEVSIYDENGEGVTARKAPNANSIEDTEGRLAVAVPIRSMSLPRDSQPGGATEPEKPAMETLGCIRLVLSKQNTFHQQGQTILFSLIVLAAGLLSTALLARRMGKKISEPIRGLTLAVHALSKGNMDVRAETEAEAELAYLQAGFNAMAAELKKNRDLLEYQVQQATLRLRDTLAALEKRNQELELARKLAEEQADIKSRFLAQVSHEIRTPMNGIIGFADLLAKTPLTDSQRDKLGLITRSARNLLSIINEILDLSRLEAGWINLNPQSFELRPCLEDVVALLSCRVRQPGIVLWMEPDIPTAIEGDAVRLQQVIANLLGNALKFTKQGRIVLRVRKRRSRLWFSVSDSGCGISSKDLAELWPPSRPLGDHAQHPGRGTGFGLIIANNIVESMGGAMHLASRLNKGTSFWFDLPLKEVKAQSQHPKLQSEVVLIEPDRLYRRALSLQLESLGAKVQSFADYADYLSHPSEEYPNVLVYALRSGGETTALPLCLQWCDERGIRPVLLFPCGERRMVGFYRKLGIECIRHPVQSETLARALGSSSREAKQPDLAQMPWEICGRLRFLLADDNEINRLLAREQLGRFGVEIIEAEDGAKALTLLRQQAFDMVLLDLQMPLLDGRSVLRMVREHPGPNRETPAIAITAFHATGQKEALLREGFAGCLLKPVLQAQLADLISRLLDGRDVDLSESNLEEVSRVQGYAEAILERTSQQRELATVIARKLFAELPVKLAEIKAAIAGLEAEAARQAVHMVNGSASFAGLSEIRQAAAQLEAALLQGDCEEIQQSLYQKLAQEAEDFLSRQDEILELIEQPRKESEGS